MTGDLLTAFDFEHPDYDFPSLPSTEGRVPESWEQCVKNPMPVVPEKQGMPTQEPGKNTTPATIFSRYLFIIPLLFL